MRIRRDISSVPQRSASDTWQSIIDLVTSSDSIDKDQLSKATGVIASIIADEHPASRAMVLEGVGPQLRLYCRFGLKAIEEAGAVDRLTWNPTAGDWTMHIPCDAENIKWVTASLAKTSPRIKVFDVSTDEPGEAESTSASRANGGIVVDWNFRG